MNLFAITIWGMALLPLAGHLFCLWTARTMPTGPKKTAALLGLAIGLLIVTANIIQLVAWNSPVGQHHALNLVAAPIGALILSVPAIALMRRSKELDVQSIGITATIVSLLSMASVIALGSMTIGG